MGQARFVFQYKLSLALLIMRNGIRDDLTYRFAPDSATLHPGYACYNTRNFRAAPTMIWTNPTQRQHYLPQVEQRLNAANPDAKPQNQRIYPFEVVDRDTCGLRLVDSNGYPISNNLAFEDLFSFDMVPGTRERMNFENIFNRYESSVRQNTTSLLEKLDQGNMDVSGELGSLYVAKLLNFVRNPFCIAKALNTFGMLTSFAPTSPEQRITFERVLKGRKPHQTRLCQNLGISDEQYQQWLGMLFMLFIQYGDGDLNILEGTVKSMFEAKEHAVAVLVSVYNKEHCLLSDRSFSTMDTSWASGFDFNLCSRAFIRYIFADIDDWAASRLPESIRESHPTIVENFKTMRPTTPNVQLLYKVDDMTLLAGYNRGVIQQSYRHVYCASKLPPFVHESSPRRAQ